MSTQAAKKLADAAVDVLWSLYSGLPLTPQTDPSSSGSLRHLLACVDSLARQGPELAADLHLHCLITANYMLLDHLTEVG
jgi:hypothetical protein